MARPALTFLAALLAVTTTVTPALAQYRIGMSAAITGPASSTYAPTYEAYKIYFQRVNDAGGINGQKVEIAYEDDRGEPQRAAANAKKLGEGTILMVNASTSATYKPFMTESESEKIPLLFGGGVCPARRSRRRARSFSARRRSARSGTAASRWASSRSSRGGRR